MGRGVVQPLAVQVCTSSIDPTASQKKNPFIKERLHWLGKGHYFSYVGMVGIKIDKKSHTVGNAHH